MNFLRRRMLGAAALGGAGIYYARRRGRANQPVAPPKPQPAPPAHK